MRRVLCMLILSNFISGMFAQDMAPDTVLNLKDVTIYSSRISRFAKGQSLQAADSLTRSEYPAGSLAELLPGFTSSYIKNYGQGTLSTISFRGTSANHAGVLWNGIRVSPPNIGYVDLSLVQGVFFNDISVLYGGASPMFGSGAIGGSIHLENRPVFEQSGFEANLDLSAGSFATMAAEGRAMVYRDRFYSRTAFSFLNSANDFSYINTDGDKEQLSHASVFKSGLIQDISFQLPGNQYIIASGWFQYANREIPPTMTEEKSEAVQTDRSWRTMILWKDYNERNNLEAKIAYFNEFTRYDDPPALVYSTIKSQTVTGEFESTWEAGRNSAIFVGTQFTYEYADLIYYDQPENQENLAVFASWKHNFPKLKWQLSLNGRQEFFTGYQSPFLFSAGTEGKIWHSFSGRINVSRNFRAPTFNERFWQPGGNPDLEPEKSWNAEAGIGFEKEFAVSIIKLSITGFNSRVENWIIWLPVTPSYWSVENAQEVWSRGVEFSGSQSVKYENWKFFFAESYTFSKSTNEKKLFDLDASYKKQLIYTPLHRLELKTGAIGEGYNFTLKGNYTGEIYTTRDNSGSLPAVLIMDVVISKSFKLRKEYPFAIQLNLNNILNTRYQVTPYRPMPGINFLLTIKTQMGKIQQDDSH